MTPAESNTMERVCKLENEFLGLQTRFMVLEKNLWEMIQERKLLRERHKTQGHN
jgi:hypothetical protein